MSSHLGVQAHALDTDILRRPVLVLLRLVKIVPSSDLCVVLRRSAYPQWWIEVDDRSPNTETSDTHFVEPTIVS